MKYRIKFTSQFKKDIKLAKKQNKDLNKLFDVVNTLASGKPLDDKYKDHSLLGKYRQNRECHIEPDWILMYEINEEYLVLVLNRLETHADLFKK